MGTDHRRPYASISLRAQLKKYFMATVQARHVADASRVAGQLGVRAHYIAEFRNTYTYTE